MPFIMAGGKKKEDCTGDRNVRKEASYVAKKKKQSSKIIERAKRKGPLDAEGFELSDGTAGRRDGGAAAAAATKGCGRDGGWTCD